MMKAKITVKNSIEPLDEKIKRIGDAIQHVEVGRNRWTPTGYAVS
jgi:hypothetical protein